MQENTHKMAKNMTSFLETERLFACIPKPDDLDNYIDMFSNKEFVACYGVAYDRDKVALRLQDDINHWNKNGFSPWMWFNKSNHAYVGRGGLKSFTLDQKSEVELTYQIRQEYWGQGIAGEKGLASINYAFKELNLESIICFTAENNHKSLRVMEKLGFIYEKDFVHADIIHKLYRMRNFNR